MVDAWATPQQVIDVTGVTVTSALLTQAQAAMEVHSNRIFADTARIRPRDAYWLGRAVAYQAAWMQGQYDLNTRMDASQVQQDGLVASLEEKAMVLAPQAKWALQRCSWMRSRTVHVRSPLADGQRGVASALSEAGDEQHAWQPLGGGR
ncbi:hypothetical protein [Streptomyces sp. NPDC002994]|uniref:hypothetical protein n=1 Tax=Streptomyces sp. NPDC002994 TaxID=3154441 RepID=UPI0033A821D5